MADAQKMRDAANEAEQWVLTIMRGSNAESRYTQAVMRQARERIQKLALLLHDAAHGMTVCLPRSDSEEAADGIEAVMAERNYPCAPKNAARVGWEAAFRWLRSHGVAVPQTPKEN